MKAQEIHWADWHRILFGTAPDHFMLEVLVRTAIIYLILLVVLRLLGKRMGGQLTISELAVMLTLGAIISIPMQVPDKGLLQGILVLFCALVFQRGINYLAIKSSRIEHITQGREKLLIKNGVILTSQLKKMKISREQMLAVLRNKKVFNLGEVRRVYVEACGLFSIYTYEKPMYGLPLLPPGDADAGGAFERIDGRIVCEYCGNPNVSVDDMPCDNCGSDRRTPAVITK